MSLPTVPDAGTNRADIRDSENEQEPEPFETLDDGAEIEDGLEVVEKEIVPDLWLL